MPSTKAILNKAKAAKKQLEIAQGRRPSPLTRRLPQPRRPR